MKSWYACWLAKVTNSLGCMLGNFLVSKTVSLETLWSQPNWPGLSLPSMFHGKNEKITCDFLSHNTNTPQRQHPPSPLKAEWENLSSHFCGMVIPQVLLKPHLCNANSTSSLDQALFEPSGHMSSANVQMEILEHVGAYCLLLKRKQHPCEGGGVGASSLSTYYWMKQGPKLPESYLPWSRSWSMLTASSSQNSPFYAEKHRVIDVQN